jgi:DNA-directed RNA polymerase subunit omega
MKLVEGFDSNYRYVLVAARRARQIQNGAIPVVKAHSGKPCRIAEEEIQAGMVKWVIPPPEKTPVVAASETLDGVIGGEADD